MDYCDIPLGPLWPLVSGPVKNEKANIACHAIRLYLSNETSLTFLGPGHHGKLGWLSMVMVVVVVVVVTCVIQVYII